MSIPSSYFRFFLVFAAVAMNFFFIGALTFSSLGVVLPHMIAEFGWSWAEAGLGFTFLALATGVCSPLPAVTLRYFGPRGNYGLGATVIVGGFLLLSSVWGLMSFLMAATIIGVGFALLANVPGVTILSEWAEEKNRSLVIGSYLTIGGLGGVVGPLLALSILGDDGDWRSFWNFSAVIMALLGIFAVSVVAHRQDRYQKILEEVDDVKSGRKEKGPSAFATLKEAMTTPQFGIIVMSLTVIYFCGLTVSSWLPIHMTGRNFAAGFAAVALSTQAAANAASRALGGLIAKKIKTRYLLISGLLSEAAAMFLLATATTDGAIIAFALLQGYAFGMVLFASTVVQLEYFGHEKSAAMLGTMNLAATTAMIGPTITGAVGDVTGGFSLMFFIYGGVALLCAGLAFFMRSPDTVAVAR
jgi:MFS transporter, OFA family, oxalate/formate antiporter